MGKRTAGSDEGAELRRRAEVWAHSLESRQVPEPLSAEETRQMLHELRVHQIELELQNEELRRAQAELETAQARYFDLYGPRQPSGGRAPMDSSRKEWGQRSATTRCTRPVGHGQRDARPPLDLREVRSGGTNSSA